MTVSASEVEERGAVTLLRLAFGVSVAASSSFKDGLGVRRNEALGVDTPAPTLSLKMEFVVTGSALSNCAQK